MPKTIIPFYGHLTGGSVPIETLMGTLQAGAAGRGIKVSDITVTGDAPCWFWLATANDGTLHVWSYYLGAAGVAQPTLETPIVLANGDTLFALYNALDGGTLFEISVQGERLE